MLATVAEEGRAKSEEGRQKIKEYMKVFKERHIQNIILGCTHYPIYEEMIREELGYKVNLINTGKQVSNYLEENFSFKKQEFLNKKIFLSKPSNEFKNILKIILGENLEVFDAQSE